MSKQEKREIEPESQLLSSRIYSGVLEPQSHLIYNFKELEESLENRITKEKKNISIYLQNLRDGASMGINEDTEFEPASLNKLIIAIITMIKVEQKEIDLEDRILIKESDVDKASGNMHKRVGQEVSIRELLSAMLSESDNTSFRVLSHKTNIDDWKKISEYLYFYETYNNNSFKTTTPELNSHIFSSLYLSTILQQENSEYLLKLLTESSFNITEIAELPEKTKIAQKFGTYYNNGEKYFHDCGILYLEDARFSYCIMTKGLTGEEGEKEIGKIIHEIYEYIEKSKENLKEINLI